MRKIVLSAIVISAAAGGYWYLSVESYKGPPKTSEEVGSFSKTSSIVLPISVSLDELQRQANEKIPEQLARIDEGRDGCVPAKWVKVSGIKTKVSPEIDCDLDGAVTRGPVTVGGSGRDLVLSAPVRAQVTVRGRGAIGRHIRETGYGAIDAAVGVNVDLSPDWTPQVALNPGYRWTDRFGITVFGISITFASKIDPKINEQLQNFRSALPGLVSQLRVRERAEEGWRKGFTVIPVSVSPPLWVRFTPREVSFPGYAIEGRSLNAQIAVSGVTETFIGPKPPEAAPTPLPSLNKDLKPSGFDLFVPVQASYVALAQEAKKALNVGQERIVKVDGVGDVRVTIGDIALHQTTGRKLAIGVKLSAKPPQSFLATSGMVWLIGDVAVDNAAKRLSVKSLAVYSQTDNAPVDLLVSLVRVDAFNKAIRDALAYDFSRDYDRVIAESPKMLNRDLGNGARLTGKLASASVEDVRFSPDGVLLGLAAKGDVRIAVGAP